MKNSSSKLILGAVALLILLICSLIFEFKEVPDVNWKKDYDLESEAPYGGWTFVKMVEQYYDTDTIPITPSDFVLDSLQDTSSLLIVYGRRITLNEEALVPIKEFVAKGNEVFFIAEAIDLGIDSTYTWDYFPTFVDTTLNIRFNRDTTKSYSYDSYDGNFDKKADNYYYHFYPDFIDYFGFEPIAKAQDSLDIMCAWPVDQGKIYMHLIPELYSNIAAKQAFYLDHFNETFDHFSSDKVYMQHTSLLRNSVHEDILGQNPLQYLHQEASLKSAYYTLIFGLFLYIIFYGKRRQKPIRQIDKNKNTSLEYIDTVSTLFMNQQQNHKLVKHLEDLFFHHIQKKYYLDKNQEDLLEVLSKKAKYPKEDLSQILNNFGLSNSFSCSDTTLIQVYQSLEKFYKTSA